MATFPAKALAFAAGIGGVGGASYGAYYLTTSKEEKKNPKQETINKAKPVTEFLKGKGLKLIPTADAKWNEKWTSFKEKKPKEKPKAPWTFSEWPLTKSPDDLNIFKQQCEALSKKEILNETDPIYVEVSTHCSTELAPSER